MIITKFLKIFNKFSIFLSKYSLIFKFSFQMAKKYLKEDKSSI